MAVTNEIDYNTPSSDYIFKRLFAVKTVREALIDVDRAEKYGVRSSGDKRVDRQLTGSFVYPFLNISSMAETMDAGFYIGLVNPDKDAVRLYNYVQYHLESWMTVMNRSINTIEAPVEDLIKLENLASAVYGVASKYFSEPPRSSFSSFISGFGNDITMDVEEMLTNSSPLTGQEAERFSFHEKLLEQQAKLLKG